jgi:hypothetical protein
VAAAYWGTAVAAVTASRILAQRVASPLMRGAEPHRNLGVERIDLTAA